MRKVLLASAAVVVGLGVTGFSTDAKADFWATLNVNKGYVDGDLYLHDFSVYKKSSISAGNIGALTVNENEENRNVRIKGPVVSIEVNQDAKNRNDQAAYQRAGQTAVQTNVDTDVQSANPSATAAASADADGGKAVAGNLLSAQLGLLNVNVNKADADARAQASASASASANVNNTTTQVNAADQDIRQSDDDYNRQYASNYSSIYVENQLRGLLNCGCSFDDFYTANINYGTVSGDVHAGRFSLDHGSSLSAGNIGAATINKSVNNLDVKIGTRRIRR